MSATAQAVALAGWLLAASGAALLVRARLRAATRAELVARAAHELRGPLFAAGLALHGLGRRGVPVGPACAELDRARLALADLEAARKGTLAGRVGADRVDLGALVAAHADAWRAAAHAHGARLVVATPPSCPVVVAGDGLRLAQAVANLVVNAAEHGGGRIDLCVGRFGGRAQVVVQDEGPGLPAAPDVLVARGPCAGRRARGRGLGVVVDVVRAHGGLLVSSPCVRGARLVLELPEEQPALMSAAQSVRAAPGLAGSQAQPSTPAARSGAPAWPAPVAVTTSLWPGRPTAP